MELYVSPAGNDAWSGQRGDPNGERTDGPLATLERARDVIRDLKKASAPPAGGITVTLRGGLYARQSTFELTAEDSGTPEAPITYRAHGGETARINGGRVVDGFQPVADPAIRARLTERACANVLQLDLKAQGITHFGALRARGFGRATEPSALELFFNDKPMPLARWPNDRWARIASSPDGPEGRRFGYAPGQPDDWAQSEDIWVYGYWTYDWADSYERVKRIDTANRVIETYGLGPWGYTPGNRYIVLNVLEELDAPGEWVLDRTSGHLYFWPPEPITAGAASVSLLEAPLVTLRDVSHVTLQGLAFECARGSGVIVTGGSHNLVAGCTFRNLGNAAVCIGEGIDDYASRIYNNSMWNRNGGTSNGVAGCDIHDTGEGGILLGGGDRKTLTPAGNYAVNNHLYDTNRIARTYRPAIAIDGVGNRVGHNLIHNLPHFAIWLHGNEHTIEYNEIHHVCVETNDAGAFYMGRDFTERGNVVRFNYFHDLGDGDLVQSVYLDDCASGTLMFGNLCVNAGRGVMIGGGRDNTIENNIFVNGRPAVHVDARGIGWASFWFNGKEPVLMDRLKVARHDQPPYSERYPPLANLLQNHPEFPRGNRILRNIRAGGRWLDLLDGLEPRYFEMKDNLVEGDAGFVDAENGNFHLKPDSPALALGFQPIPLEKIGLYWDEYRATLP